MFLMKRWLYRPLQLRVARVRVKPLLSHRSRKVSSLHGRLVLYWSISVTSFIRVFMLTYTLC